MKSVRRCCRQRFSVVRRVRRPIVSVLLVLAGAIRPRTVAEVGRRCRRAADAQSSGWGTTRLPSRGSAMRPCSSTSTACACSRTRRSFRGLACTWFGSARPLRLTSSALTASELPDIDLVLVSMPASSPRYAVARRPSGLAVERWAGYFEPSAAPTVCVRARITLGRIGSNRHTARRRARASH
jgi:hypothetical protein